MLLQYSIVLYYLGQGYYEHDLTVKLLLENSFNAVMIVTYTKIL